MNAVDVEITIQRKQRRNTRQSGHGGDEDVPQRIPRISRLMALAIKFQEMVDQGEVRDYAELARLGYVTRARLTHIMNLLLLAPDIQEDILGVGWSAARKAIVTERNVRSLVSLVFWDHQRREWLAGPGRN